MAGEVQIEPVGLVIRRVGRPYVIEAVRMLEAGEGTVAGIDAAMEAAGHDTGPLRRLDEAGLDVDLAIDRELAAEFEMTTRFDPPDLQVALVSQGRLGRSAGHGFYRYPPGSTPTPDVAIEPSAQLAAPEIVERLELGMVNEAYRVVEEGLAAPPLIDATIRDAGHPRGPFEIVDALGLRAAIDRLRATHAHTEPRSGDQYLVAASLWQLAIV